MAFHLVNPSVTVSVLLKIRITFCFRHATQAVILRVISGGLRSPNDSRKALTAGGEGSSMSMIVGAVM
jgi:hypothetical protein